MTLRRNCHNAYRGKILFGGALRQSTSLLPLCPTQGSPLSETNTDAGRYRDIYAHTKTKENWPNSGLQSRTKSSSELSAWRRAMSIALHTGMPRAAGVPVSSASLLSLAVTGGCLFRADGPERPGAVADGGCDDSAVHGVTTCTLGRQSVTLGCEGAASCTCCAIKKMLTPVALATKPPPMSRRLLCQIRAGNG
jgi:hypothetical protein